MNHLPTVSFALAVGLIDGGGCNGICCHLFLGGYVSSAFVLLQHLHLRSCYVHRRNIRTKLNMSTMLSNYCRPSNRPPEVVDLSTNEQELDDHPKHASPRCTNSDIFLSHHAKNKPANEQANETNQSPRNSPYKDEEETPADVAMLLTSLSPTVSKEIEANPDVTATSIANAFPFPNLAEGSNEGHAGEYEAMDYENLQPSAPLVHFDHKKKTRSVSMDATKAITFGIYTPSPSPPHEEEEVDNTTLLQWRDLRGHSTSPPHAHGIFSTPPPSPHLSSRRKHGMLNRIPTSEYRRSSKDQGTLGHRPRSVSLAEAALVIGMPTLDLTKPGDSTGTDKKVKKLILRKKFSWKNYPEVIYSICRLCVQVLHYNSHSLLYLTFTES